MDYEVLLFDADGTLFDYYRAEEYALQKMIKYFDLNFKGDFHLSLYREINQQIWNEFEQGQIEVDELKWERFKRFFEDLDLKLDPREASISYLKFMGEADFLLPGAKEVLTEVVDEYRLVLITNGLSDVQNSRLDRSSLRSYFESIIISEEVGVPKPEPDIFDYTLQQIDYYDKDRMLMIGDSLSSDIRGGINYGLRTCWYNADNRPLASDVDPDHIITDLKELLEILEIH